MKDDARHHYFEQEQPKGGGLLAYTNGYEKGFQMALCEIRWIIERCNNNLDRLNAIKELVKEVHP